MSITSRRRAKDLITGSAPLCLLAAINSPLLWLRPALIVWMSDYENSMINF